MKKIAIVGIAVFLGVALSLGVRGQTPIEPKAFDIQEKEIDGKAMLVRVTVTQEEKQQLDQVRIAELQTKLATEGGGAQQQQGQDPYAIAVWTYWWEQAKLWEQYIKQNLFYKPLVTDIKTIDWTSQETVQQSADSIVKQVVVQAEEINEAEHQENLKFLDRLRAREEMRTGYEDWIRSKQDMLLEFADQWVKRQKGETVSIDGNIYMVSREPLQKIPRDAINIVTRKLTPYDLLNADGTLKSLPKE